MKSLLIITLLLFPVLCYGQSNWHDSLKHLVNTQQLTPDQKMGAYHFICDGYAATDMENTYKYGMMGLELAIKAGDKRMIATFYRYIGSTYAYRIVYDTAHIYQQMHIDIAEELQDRDLLLLSYFGIANLYARQAKFALAIENYRKAMRFYDKDEEWEIKNIESFLPHLDKTYLFHNPHRTYLLCLGNAGECYRRLNNPEKALEYLNEAKDLLESGKQAYNDGTAFVQIYRELGYVLFALGDLDKALEHFHKALSLPNGLGPVQESDCKEALIKIHIVKKEYDKALEYANDCLRLAKGLGDPYIDVLAWNSFANIYRAQGRYRECEAAATKAWSIDSTSVDTAPVSAFNIAYASLLLGDKEKAEYFFRKNEEFNIEKSNRNFQESLADMEVQYETEKKEMRIVSLEKEKQLYVWIGIAGILFAISLGVLLWQNTRNTRKEKQLIATRAVLDGEMGERIRLARDLHDRLSGSLSALKIGLKDNDKAIASVHNKLDDCIEEVRRISHNLMPASLQFGLRTALGDYARQFPNVRFHFFGRDKRTDEQLEFMVYCCASELVTNALRHSGAKYIDMQLVQEEKSLSLTVQDDGCGFDGKHSPKGIGLKNIRDRIISCNGRIDITTSPDKGTEITIELKI